MRLFFDKYYHHLTDGSVLLSNLKGKSVDVFILPPLVDYMKMVVSSLSEINLSGIALIKPHPSFYDDKSYLILKELLSKHYSEIIFLEDSAVPIEAVVNNLPTSDITVFGRFSTGLFNISKMYKDVNVVIFLPKILESNSNLSSFPKITINIIAKAFSDKIKMIYEK